MILTILLPIQVATFVVLGFHYLSVGNWRLGTAQLLLAGVQSVVYV